MIPGISVLVLRLQRRTRSLSKPRIATYARKQLRSEPRDRGKRRGGVADCHLAYVLYIGRRTGEAEELFKSDDALIAACILFRAVLQRAMPLPLGGLRSERICLMDEDA